MEEGPLSEESYEKLPKDIMEIIPPFPCNGVVPTIKFTHYPTLDFAYPVVPQISSSSLAQVSTYLQSKYKELRERNVRMSKEARQ